MCTLYKSKLDWWIDALQFLRSFWDFELEGARFFGIDLEISFTPTLNIIARMYFLDRSLKTCMITARAYVQDRYWEGNKKSERIGSGRKGKLEWNAMEGGYP